MPGRTPMNASISAGLRRVSLLRSAALRSGAATIAANRLAGAGGADAGRVAQPAISATAVKASAVRAAWWVARGIVSPRAAAGRRGRIMTRRPVGFPSGSRRGRASPGRRAA
jgi:hypothetical protein